MSLYDSFVSWAAGTPTQAEQDAGQAAVNAKYAEAVQRQVDQGAIDQATGQNLIAAQDAVTADSQDAGYSQGFEEGAAEGLNNVLNAPGKVVGAVGSGLSQTLWGIFKNIPWWVYLVGAGALFVWMGGLELLRGRLSKYVK